MTKAPRPKSKTVIALEAIRDHQVDGGRTFAHLLWPDNPGWKRLSKSAGRGVGMRLAGGALLGKLQKAGLIRLFRGRTRQDSYFVLTEAGEAMIKAANSDSVLFKANSSQDPFPDYVCPTCGTVTGKMCTKLKCDCHNKEGRVVMFNGIMILPIKPQ